MTDKKLQLAIKEAKSVQKEYPYFDALAEARSGALWRSLSKKQRKLVEQALMPRGETGITPCSGHGIEGSNPSEAVDVQ